MTDLCGCWGVENCGLSMHGVGCRHMVLAIDTSCGCCQRVVWAVINAACGPLLTHCVGYHRCVMWPSLTCRVGH
jgi:hypothetical protein